MRLKVRSHVPTVYKAAKKEYREDKKNKELKEAYRKAKAALDEARKSKNV